MLGGTAAAWPLTARGQQPAVGFVSGGSPDTFAYLVSAFREGLSETGYVEGRNIAIEFRWAEGQYDRLPSLVADLVRRRVSVLAATTTPRGARGQGGDQLHSNRIRDGWRSGAAWAGRQPQSAGRQCHGRNPIERGGRT